MPRSEERDRERVDTLITSDWHMGSRLCQGKAIHAMLRHFACDRIILNGDILDDRLDLHRLARGHLDLLKDLSGEAKHGVEIVYIPGNHDEGFSVLLAAFVGAHVEREYAWEFAGKRCLAIHGDQFDSFSLNHPRIAKIASDVYWWFQRVFGTWADRVSRFLKRQAKGYTNAKRHISEGALQYAERVGAHYIFCGHTHQVEHVTHGDVHYYNEGCGTERPITCITVGERGIRVHSFDESGEVGIDTLQS